MATKENILDATIDIFNEKGMKFTMDELAHSLSISKKTIYTFFPDKKTLFIEMTDYLFDQIKAEEKQVYLNPNLSTMEKLRKILVVLPDRFQEIDFTKLNALREDYPEIYSQIAKRLDSGWELTIDLYEQAVLEGSVRQINMEIFKAMLEGTINVLLTKKMTLQEYEQNLAEALSILFDGIVTC